jgi:hypothetical protein
MIPDYLFAQMSTDNNDAKVECTEQPGENKELTGARKWISENLLLLLTLFGVAFGTIVGESRHFFIFQKIIVHFFCFLSFLQLILIAHHSSSRWPLANNVGKSAFFSAIVRSVVV